MSTTHCDLLIVGAGPAGLAAARAASGRDLNLMVLDDNPLPGGQIWRARVGQVAAEVGRLPADVTLLSGTRVAAVLGPRQLLLEDASGSRTLTFDTLILCTGARELLLPFPGWTLPGVTGAGGLQALIKGGVEVADERLIVAGSGPLLLASAATARQAGARVALVAEQAARRAVRDFGLGLWRWPNKLRQALTLATLRYSPGTWVEAALGTDRLEAVRLRQGERRWEVACDRLACGYGLVPNVELAQSLGCTTLDGAVAVDDLQRTAQPHILAAGECTGIGGNELAQATGRIAGLVASGQLDAAHAVQSEARAWRRFATQLARTFALNPAIARLAQPDTLVCRCEDVPLGALIGHADWTQAKLRSRCGMGACQGRICGQATRVLLGWTPPTPRFPLQPTRIDSLLTLTEDDA
ncbi:NAD(P)/FAD-dependent oxidoreductase [Pseudomonas rhizoryzae]|uniref:NAD(P)/FAD-dependent oxidoreductase n=1 Tax=Pseudomonas rhizoryzae TaxID=2571129 RepID=UPI0007373E96|nr:FAD/NAD(P)-binding oxidoreductase [Pseudomonas rhizoryzae]KTT32368.1 pyridine nucleotide-disulfide oxidoreductase [Pseudomonas psychrotolerans]KTT35543.1 pyridine nucleotide-disulfide oxidoreductase [Pseudomonas psychrotolerans]KTT70816.1 pyridine nucleotide-disulfide oxidoreductase [Pseudomonas psychrotolerans]